MTRINDRGNLRKEIDKADYEQFMEILIQFFQQKELKFKLLNQRFSCDKNKRLPKEDD